MITQLQLACTATLAASVWLIMRGALNDTVIKLADIKGRVTCHTSGAPVVYLDVQADNDGGVVQMGPRRFCTASALIHMSNMALPPSQRVLITSETKTPYTAPEQSAE